MLRKVILTIPPHTFSFTAKYNFFPGSTRISFCKGVLSFQALSLGVTTPHITSVLYKNWNPAVLSFGEAMQGGLTNHSLVYDTCNTCTCNTCLRLQSRVTSSGITVNSWMVFFVCFFLFLFVYSFFGIVVFTYLVCLFVCMFYFIIILFYSVCFAFFGVFFWFVCFLVSFYVSYVFHCFFSYFF